tara:strand:+ start:4796 stop:4951 length:156 start_codon:yes stop_codon:yes gene_type:complete
MADAIKINRGCYYDDISITGEGLSDKIMACYCTDCQKFNGAVSCANAAHAA